MSTLTQQLALDEKQSTIAFSIDTTTSIGKTFLKFFVKIGRNEKNVYEGFINISGNDDASSQYIQKLLNFVQDQSTTSLRLGQVTLHNNKFVVESSATSCGFNCDIETNFNLNVTRKLLTSVLLENGFLTFTFKQNNTNNTNKLYENSETKKILCEMKGVDTSGAVQKKIEPVQSKHHTEKNIIPIDMSNIFSFNFPQQKADKPTQIAEESKKNNERMYKINEDLKRNKEAITKNNTFSNKISLNKMKEPTKKDVSCQNSTTPCKVLYCDLDDQFKKTCDEQKNKKQVEHKYNPYSRSQNNTSSPKSLNRESVDFRDFFTTIFPKLDTVPESDKPKSVDRQDEQETFNNILNNIFNTPKSVKPVKPVTIPTATEFRNLSKNENKSVKPVIIPTEFKNTSQNENKSTKYTHANPFDQYNPFRFENYQNKQNVDYDNVCYGNCCEKDNLLQDTLQQIRKMNNSTKPDVAKTTNDANTDSQKPEELIQNVLQQMFSGNSKQNGIDLLQQLFSNK